MRTVPWNEAASRPEVCQAAPLLLGHARDSGSIEEYFREALPVVLQASGCRGVAFVRAEKGKWRKPAMAGKEDPLPVDLLADALDEQRAMARRGWYATPLEPRGSEILAFSGLPEKTGPPTSVLEELTRMLADGAAMLRRLEEQQQRVQRLETILQIAAQWRQTLEMEQLLIHMAEAATRLLGAERASIFLWDRGSKTIVGRPALGIAGGELRIPDDRGIVGQVIQTGQPRRVDADEDQSEIDRSVDRKLDFQTTSLLCVPLLGTSGELFGAFEMVNKIEGNFTDDDLAALTELATHAAIALENTQQFEQLTRSRNRLADQAAASAQLIGQSSGIEALRSTIHRVADTDLAILILGENGTGKEIVSQQIHYLSRRRHEPFVAVNCAALTESLLESELFGHEKGAFTDARETRAGKFELASGGTLFLDEIGDMSLGGQAKLLRVLEEKVVVRVGGSVPIPTDARVIAATNQNLAELVRQKRFREDLYFRLNVVTLQLPPLRERGEDILLLAEHFLAGFSRKAGRRLPRFTGAARKRLLNHSWPGNVRELRNLMERLAYLSVAEKIDADELAFILSPAGDNQEQISLDLNLTDATRQFQVEWINRQIAAARGNITDAATRMGLHRSNLYRKMRQLGMETPQS